ncbi:DEAD/DEAH box helicase [Fastidiosipila sanguinis]|uniref:Helicase n=1 Tax=Fastidiosipila sanguinis TaxID=236753 RepID=A0A2S0KP77_9FIRM|nr:DEAD/DEAH box helicase [Fastidiosipila sanguinis]AVM42841.1 hypothetical protein C5Q98_06285 [Fastidiosipila sanguinis]
MELKLRPYQRDLIKKTHSSLVKGHQRPLVVLPTGGGKTAVFAWMSAQTQKKGNTVWFLVHRRELKQQAIDTFKKFDIPINTIHIDMVSQWKKLPKPDLIVFDEAHHATARTWEKIVEAYPDTHIIGLTATPTRLSGQPLGTVFDHLVLGVTTRQLINLGYLSDYDYIAPKVKFNTSDLKVVRGDFDRKQVEATMRDNVIYGQVLEEYKKHANGKQAIYFCATVKHSEETAEYFKNNGIEAVHFDGNTPKKERDEIIQKFRNNEIQILCNVDLIGEGFDMPNCDVVGMLRPTKSLTIFLQQAGRALRPREGKTAVIIDHVGNIDRHGLPEDQRNWSLKEKVKSKGRKIDKDGNYNIRICQDCYAAYESTLKTCPVCGEIYETTARELEVQRNIMLEKIDKEKRRKKQLYYWSSEAIDNAETYSEFMAIAKARGYKKGWAYHQCVNRGIWVPY